MWPSLSMTKPVRFARLGPGQGAFVSDQSEGGVSGEVGMGCPASRWDRGTHSRSSAAQPERDLNASSEFRESHGPAALVLSPATLSRRRRHGRRRRTATEGARMIFRQITHDDLGCASYLIGDEDAGVAAVVDPRFEVDEYLELARYMGVSIEHVLETHNHADHVSGHGRLAAATGATIHIHRDAEPDYAHEPFDDGWELALGALRVRALHTPGHRPEHTRVRADRHERGRRAVGGADAATRCSSATSPGPTSRSRRPRARAASSARCTTSCSTLPAECEVWPGAPRRLDVRRPGDGHEDLLDDRLRARHNPTLAIDDEDAFVEQALAKLGPQPPNFEAIVELNRGRCSPTASRCCRSRRARSSRSAPQGALLVDVRTDQQFDDAHIPGAVCNPMLRAGFGSKLAWLGGPRAGDRLRRARRRGRPPRRPRSRVAVGPAQARRLPARRDDELAPGAPADRARRAAAARGAAEPRRRGCRSSTCASERVGGRPHPRLGLRALARHRRAARGARPRAADRGASAPRASARRRRRAWSCATAARDVIHVVDGGVPKWGRLGHPLERSGDPAAGGGLSRKCRPARRDPTRRGPAKGSPPRRPVPGDLIAGITVALVLVPQALAYAELAGMPAEQGLYAAGDPAARRGAARLLAVPPDRPGRPHGHPDLRRPERRRRAGQRRATSSSALLLALLVGVVRARRSG